MKYCLPALLITLFFTSCNKNSEDQPACSIANFYYGGYGLAMPNAFTPNGDGRNDRYRPLFNNLYFSSYSLRIVDKDGLILFETADTIQGWNGCKSNGEALPPGRYQAQVTYRNSYSFNETTSTSTCFALLSYGGGPCIPKSADGTYLFEDMFDPNYNGFQRPTAEAICPD